MDNCCWFLVLFLIYLTKGQQEVSVTLKQDVTLACRSGAAADISVLKWSRSDLSSHGYVYFYRNKRSFQSYQHPRFQGRVTLRDAGMKDGDASVILRNATLEDAGMYECHLQLRELVEGRRSSSEVSRHINLTVTHAAETPEAMMDSYSHLEDADGDVRSRDGAVAAVTVVLLAVLVVLYCYRL
ncbi:uncharacterized protein V3H82_014114 [Fundulus diaphanus]